LLNTTKSLPKIIYLKSGQGNVKEDKVHLINRAGRQFLAGLLKMGDNDQALFMVGHKINALNFYDQKISSQLSFGNQLASKSQEHLLVNFTKSLGWNLPDRDQNTLAITENVLNNLLEARLKELPCEVIESEINHIEQKDNLINVRLLENKEIKTRKIFSTKNDVTILKYSEIDMQYQFYSQKMLSSFFSLADDLDEVYVRSFPGGFVSIIPNREKQAYVRWCFGTGNEFENPKSHNAETYATLLNEKFQQVSEHDTQRWIGTPLSYPPLLISEISPRIEKSVTWTHASKYNNKNVILLADAAHEFYPYMMHDTNINLNEIMLISNAINQNAWNPDLYSATAISQANGYGYFQHYLNYITQSNSTTLKYLQALASGLMNYFPLGGYFLNEIAHGGITPPFSFKYVPKIFTKEDTKK